MRKFITLYCLCICSLLYGYQGNMQHYSTAQGVRDLHIQSISQDEVGYLWFTSPKGVAKFDGKDFIYLNLRTNDSIIAVLPQREALYIATTKGLIVKNVQNELTFTLSNIYSLKNIDGLVYITTAKGLYQFSNQQLSKIKLPEVLNATAITQVLQHHNHYFITTPKGLFKLDTLAEDSTIQKITNYKYRKLIAIDQNMIAYDSENALILFDKELRSKKVLQMPLITDLLYLENKLWISTANNGVYVYDTADYSLLKRFSKYNGLGVNAIETIFQDRTKNMWLGTQNVGFYKLSNSDLNSFFNTTTTKVPQEPRIFLERVAINYVNVPFKNLQTQVHGTLLNPNENSISFQYKTVVIDTPYAVLYQWTLNDQKSPWSPRNEVDFAKLESGVYTFSVQSKLNNTKSEILQYQFTIDTPFYKKTSYQVGILLTIVLLIFLGSWAYIKRIQQINKRQLAEKERENLLLSLEQKALQLQMNPHFIFNVLHTIKAIGNTGNLELMNTTIQNFASLLRNVLHHSRVEEVSLAQEIETMRHYLSLEQQLTHDAFEYTIATHGFDISLDEVLIPAMLIQPFLENAIQHGFKGIDRKGMITIEFTNVQERIECVIIDNGIGYSTTIRTSKKSQHKSVAIDVTKERIAFLSGKKSFAITTLSEGNSIVGTKVWFTLPYKTDF